MAPLGPWHNPGNQTEYIFLRFFFGGIYSSGVVAGNEVVGELILKLMPVVGRGPLSREGFTVDFV
jgi:hypothetical protein